MITLDAQTVRQARDDPAVFAEALTGEPLWSHQLEVVRSPARIRCLCSGRRAGKTRTMAVESLHLAFTKPGARVLICSAGEDSAQLTLAEVADLLQAPLLRGSAVDENKSEITLTNGSQIKSVPASQKQIRGRGADLLILDEACWIDEAIWGAAKYSVVANPGSRIIMSSTPYGGKDHWFAVHFRAGLEEWGKPAQPEFASWRWPSTVSPLVDRELLELWRSTSTDREYQAEVLAEWPDDAGAWFTAAELEEAIADYQLCPPPEARGQKALAGVDWSAGIGRDSHALVLMAVLQDAGLNDERHPGRCVYYVPWLEESNKIGILDWSRKVVEVGDWRRDRYRLPIVLSEINGVGVGGSEAIWEHQRERQLGMRVVDVSTTAGLKLNAFGKLKILLQQNRLVLPRHPGLLRQLSALEYATVESGTVQIGVPEYRGHDDLAMALMHAGSCVELSAQRWLPEYGRRRDDVPLLITKGGTQIPERPRCHERQFITAFTIPR